MKISVISGACAILLFASATSIQAIAPVSIAVFPPDVNMQSARGKQRIIVQASYADGITRDVTAQAKVTISDPKIAKIVNLEVLPVGDGKCSIAVEFEGKTTQVPVDVKDAIKDRPISFKLDVMPIFLRNGCNQGGCHGAARGKDGFRLSLFGFDPDGDHYRLTRELNGRRINLAIPEESLLVEKSTGKVPHTGGQKFAVGEQYYNELVRWVDAGGPQDPAGIPTPVSVDLFPKTALLDGKGSTQQLIVRAKYSDGSERDVTSLALFLSSNDSSGKVSPNGLVTAGDRGEAFVMARFSTFTVGVPFIVLPKDLKFSFPPPLKRTISIPLLMPSLKTFVSLPLLLALMKFSCAGYSSILQACCLRLKNTKHSWQTNQQTRESNLSKTLWNEKNFQNYGF